MKDMRISPEGARFIADHEGMRLTAYKDPVGVLTIGVGHTSAAGEPRVSAGMTITEREALEILSRDIRKFEDGISAAVSVPLTQSMFDALVSFAFNVGLGAFGKSTLRRKLNARDYVGAASEFGKWNKAKGRTLPGLTRRRAEEADLFLRDGMPDMDDDAPQDEGFTAFGHYRDANMKRAQARLWDLGYRMVGIADGTWGPKTIAALAAFRAVNDLPDVQADIFKPQIDDDTLNRLFDLRALPNTRSDERENVTTAELVKARPKTMVPAVATRAAGKIASGAAVVGTAAVGAADQLGPAWTMLSAAKNFITSPWTLGALVILLAILLYVFGKGMVDRQKEAFQDGEMN